MMENRKQVNFYRLALAEGKRFRMELIPWIKTKPGIGWF